MNVRLDEWLYILRNTMKQIGHYDVGLNLMAGTVTGTRGWYIFGGLFGGLCLMSLIVWYWVYWLQSLTQLTPRYMATCVLCRLVCMLCRWSPPLIWSGQRRFLGQKNVVLHWKEELNNEGSRMYSTFRTLGSTRKIDVATKHVFISRYQLFVSA
jgi:hypothetical protein